MGDDPGGTTRAMSSGVGVCRIYIGGQLLRLCYGFPAGVDIGCGFCFTGVSPT